jgi:hypothetical protein
MTRPSDNSGRRRPENLRIYWFQAFTNCYVESVLGLLHCVDVGEFSDVLDVHAAYRMAQK